MRSSLPGWIEHWARERGEQPVIVFAGTQVSWHEFGRRVRNRAAQLARQGVGPGDRVACLAHNRPEYLEIFWAVQRLGAVFVALNTRLAPAELARIINDSRPALLIREDDDTLVPLDRLAVHDVSLPTVLTLPPFQLPFELAPLNATLTPPEPHSSDVDAPAAIVYTSGSTGLPKGAVITHGNIMALTQLWQASFDQTARDRNLVSMPLCFTGGLLASSMTSFCTGARLVIMRQFAPAEALALVEHEAVTYGIVVPTMLERIVAADEFAAADLSSLRGLQVGGAAPTEATIRAVQERRVQIVNAYGLTEASAGATLTLTAEQARTRPTAVGRSTLGNTVRVTDEAGRPLGPNEVGELEVSGPLVFAGYWDNPEATADARHDEWLRTGDLAEIDTDGVVTLRGRKKDLIITGGLNVYPAEIERVLTTIDGVSEAAVIGRPDAQWGESVTALVLPRPGVQLDPEAIRARCRVELAGYKVPREVRIVDDLPRLASGKIDKVALRATSG